MLRSISLVIMILGIIFSLGCSGSPATPGQNDELDKLLGGVELPSPTGVVGSYTFTANDGSIETGQVTRAEDGTLTFMTERGASAYNLSWFNASVEFLNPRGYWNGYAVWYTGDTVEYEVYLDYNRGLPLNNYPILYAKMTTEQRFYPSGVLLPGDSVEVWDPLEIAPYSNNVIYDEYYIPTNCPHGWGSTICIINIAFMYGVLDFEIQYLVMGVWDP
ncbi:hypothetical protein KKB99_02145 [bacterium]|nr:hypothetical protein [bacterium]MBU1024788.1 hypothetical protein [bacterium]